MMANDGRGDKGMLMVVDGIVMDVYVRYETFLKMIMPDGDEENRECGRPWMMMKESAMHAHTHPRAKSINQGRRITRIDIIYTL